MSGMQKDRPIRRLAEMEQPRALPLESLAGNGAQAPLAVPQFGLISRKRLREIFSEDLAILTDEARKEGLERGLEQAHFEMAEAARRADESRAHQYDSAMAEISERIERLDALLGALHQHRESILQDAEADLIELMHGCLIRLLGDMAPSTTLIKPLITAALDSMPRGESLTIRLSIADHAALSENGKLNDISSRRAVHFTPDVRLHTGQCLIDSTRGTLDASLMKQLDSLREKLTETYKLRKARHEDQAL